MKRFMLINLILVLAINLCGCGGQKKETTEAAGVAVENAVYVCYPSKDKVVKSSESYQLKQPDSIVPSVEEVMSVSMDYYDGKLESYSYMVDDNNNVTLNIVVAGDYTREFGLLVMASISDTMFQLEMVESVKITLNSAEGEQLDAKLMLRSTIYHYGDSDKQQTKRVTLYKAASNGEALEGLSGTLVLDDHVSMVENAVLELERIGAIPEDTRVNSVSLVSGVCYLDLSEEFEGSVEGIKSELVVYSVVNSLTSFNNINSVMITIDGNVVGSYRGSVNLSNPLSFNSSILK